jgi:glycosyltransferase involved in cell wall biosynthesis
VLSRCPEDERPIFTLVGDGPERPKVQKEAQRLGVLPYLELPGLLPRSEVRRILHESDLFILPTVKEALSIATIEARSAGLPVVAMAQSGVRDVVAHQQNGLLARTQEEFEDAVISLLQNHELRNRLASAAQNGLERFSWDSVIREHLFAYHLAMGIAARRK